MFMTAAGTVPPAKVLVMGAGVAGLQAIATARRLGAQVRAYDVRAAAKEEVQSLGARFVELDLETQDGSGGYAREQSEEFLAKQQELLAAEVAAADVVITTAQIPGRTAPVLVTAAMVARMAEGAVIIDVAADSGGNCELTVAGPGGPVTGGVAVVGLANPPATMPTHASFLYARNVANFLGLLITDGATHAPISTTRSWPGPASSGPVTSSIGPRPRRWAFRRTDRPIPRGQPASRCGRNRGRAQRRPDHEHRHPGVRHHLRAGRLRGQRGHRQVPSILHTPLMSGSNAIHGIVLVGTILIMGSAHGAAQITLGFLAVLLATLNIVGGFVVTDRMLEMFKAKPRPTPLRPPPTASRRPTRRQ